MVGGEALLDLYMAAVKDINEWREKTVGAQLTVRSNTLDLWLKYVQPGAY